MNCQSILPLLVAFLVISCEKHKDNGDPISYYNNGYTSFQLEDYEGAVIWFSRDINSNGANYLSLNGRYKAYRELDKLEDAENDLYELLELTTREYEETGDPKSLILTVRVFSLMGDMERARELIELAQERHPDYVKKWGFDFEFIWTKGRDEGLEGMVFDHSKSEQAVGGNRGDH